VKHEVVRCPYCGRQAKIGYGREIYPNCSRDVQDKRFYVCWRCSAWVGCHDGTFTPLGTLANSDLRLLRTTVHSMFDPLWASKIKREKIAKHEARMAGYTWLAGELGIPVDDCHVGRFDKPTCEKAILILERWQK
jgi:hypothetical protein